MNIGLVLNEIYHFQCEFNQILTSHYDIFILIKTHKNLILRKFWILILSLFSFFLFFLYSEKFYTFLKHFTILKFFVCIYFFLMVCFFIITLLISFFSNILEIFILYFLIFFFFLSFFLSFFHDLFIQFSYGSIICYLHTQRKKILNLYKNDSEENLRVIFIIIIKSTSNKYLNVHSQYFF